MGLRLYLQKNKKTVLAVAGFTLVFSLLRMLFYTVSYDTDEWLISPSGTLETWLGLGRYTLVFLKYLFAKSGNLLLLNILTYVAVFIYTVLFLYFLNIDREAGQIKRDVLCAAALISSPIFLEQYYFTLQTAEVSFAMILIVISFITTYYLLKERKWQYGIWTFLLLVFCFGTYQSFVNLYVIGVLICLYKLNREETKKNLQGIGISIAVFAAGLAAYAIISESVIRYFHITTTGYLEIAWFGGEFAQALKTVIIVIGRILLGHGNVLNLSYTLCLIYVMYKMIKNWKGVTWRDFYLAALLISPFLLNVLTASHLVIRSALGFPVLCTFIFWEYFESGKGLRTILYVVLVSQICHSQLLLYSDYIRYRHDAEISEKIYQDCNADENTVIVFRGIEHPEEEVFAFKGQAMGHSFYEWSSDTKNAEEIRILYFMKTLGLELAYPSEEQLAAADIIDFKAEYPNDGYIVEKDGIYYVNLGNE